VHKKYGGVIPEIAGRKHAENIMPVIEEVMKNQKKPDALAVTSEPGLITGLIVGVEAAKTISYLLNIPIIKINHIEGHIYSPFVNKKCDIKFPAICLIASGGHTQIILMKKNGNYKTVGSTRDDAAGEAFDKVGKLLGLEYPGGPKISKFAEKGNPEFIKFPRPMIDSNDFDMSFAGLKTSVLYWIKDNVGKKKISKKLLCNICASFEQAVADVFAEKTIKAVKKYKATSIIFAGGVSANKKIRGQIKTRAGNELKNTTLYIPELDYCMDNAAMIATAGYFHAVKKQFIKWDKIQANPNGKLR
jgi:N6-L-threonylcarbamoyladenine synthase